MSSRAVDATRERILEAAVRLLSEGGEEAASTRAVSAAAGVQAPTIYRHFRDKRRLLDAAAVRTFEAYVESKSAREPGSDPVEDLRTGWDDHIAFGLANPVVYELVYAQSSRGEMPAAAAAGATVLRGHIHRIALAGRLRVPEPRAAQLLQSAGRGTVLTLIGAPAAERDPGLSALAREAVISAIATDAGAHGPGAIVSAAVALRAAVSEETELTEGERTLMAELLDRIAA